MVKERECRISPTLNLAAAQETAQTHKHEDPANHGFWNSPSVGRVLGHNAGMNRERERERYIYIYTHIDVYDGVFKFLNSSPVIEKRTDRGGSWGPSQLQHCQRRKGHSEPAAYHGARGHDPERNT